MINRLPLCLKDALQTSLVDLPNHFEAHPDGLIVDTTQWWEEH